MLHSNFQLNDVLGESKYIKGLVHDLKGYMPAYRYKVFKKAWLINNFIKAPVIRKRLEASLKFQLPSVINFSPSFKCNRHCRGCYANLYEKKAVMTIDQVDEIIRQGKNLGVYYFGLLGGEPLLNPDLLDVIGKYPDIAFRITTNGTLINSKIIEKLDRCGNIVLFFSIEGYQNETDFWRGQGNFQMITNNMLELKKARVLFGFSAILHNKNKNVLVSYEFLKEMERLGNRMGVIYPYGPVGVNQYFELVIKEPELNQCFEDLLLIEQNLKILLLLEGYISPHNSLSYFFNMGCNAGRNVHITPEGFVEPCNGIQFYTKNIFNEPLVNILNSSIYQDIVSCALENNRRCLVIYEPRKIYEIVRNNDARGTNAGSFSNLINYCNGRK